jgi:hypothetical protein
MKVTLISLRLLANNLIYLGIIWIICLRDRRFFIKDGNVDPKIIFKLENNGNLLPTFRLKYTFDKQK